MSSNIRHLITFNKFLFTNVVHKRSFQGAVTLIPSCRFNSTKKVTPEEDEGPIQYSTSRAGTWTARQSRVGTRIEEDIPWFQPYAISLSLAVFLLYFCVFREENDVDEELGRSLYDRISGLEKKQLEISLQYNLENSLDTADIQNRLQEIEQEEK